MDKFVKSIKVVYINRRKQVPSKEDIYGVSTCKNESIVKYSRVENDTPLSLREYEELFPKKDIRTSFKKLKEMNPLASHSDALKWFENERKQKPKQFRKSANGGFIAYCSKCGKKEFPNDKYQPKAESSCCRVEYINR